MILELAVPGQDLALEVGVKALHGILVFGKFPTKIVNECYIILNYYIMLKQGCILCKIL